MYTHISTVHTSAVAVALTSCVISKQGRVNKVEMAKKEINKLVIFLRSYNEYFSSNWLKKIKNQKYCLFP